MSFFESAFYYFVVKIFPAISVVLGVAIMQFLKEKSKNSLPKNCRLLVKGLDKNKRLVLNISFLYRVQFRLIPTQRVLILNLINKLIYKWGEESERSESLFIIYLINV